MDTALKRRSGSAVGRRVPGAGVTPDVTKPAAWRQAAAWGYAGIASSAPAYTPGGAFEVSLADSVWDVALDETRWEVAVG